MDFFPSNWLPVAVPSSLEILKIISFLNIKITFDIITLIVYLLQVCLCEGFDFDCLCRLLFTGTASWHLTCKQLDLLSLKTFNAPERSQVAYNFPLRQPWSGWMVTFTDICLGCLYLYRSGLKLLLLLSVSVSTPLAESWPKAAAVWVVVEAYTQPTQQTI